MRTQGSFSHLAWVQFLPWTVLLKNESSYRVLRITTPGLLPYILQLLPLEFPCFLKHGKHTGWKASSSSSHLCDPWLSSPSHQVPSPSSQGSQPCPRLLPHIHPVGSVADAETLSKSCVQRPQPQLARKRWSHKEFLAVITGPQPHHPPSVHQPIMTPVVVWGQDGGSCPTWWYRWWVVAPRTQRSPQLSGQGFESQLQVAPAWGWVQVGKPRTLWDSQCSEETAGSSPQWSPPGLAASAPPLEPVWRSRQTACWAPPGSADWDIRRRKGWKWSRSSQSRSPHSPPAPLKQAEHSGQHRGEKKSRATSRAGTVPPQPGGPLLPSLPQTSGVAWSEGPLNWWPSWSGCWETQSVAGGSPSMWAAVRAAWQPHGLLGTCCSRPLGWGARATGSKGQQRPPQKAGSRHCGSIGVSSLGGCWELPPPARPFPALAQKPWPRP